jgi:hypothetical protein
MSTNNFDDTNQATREEPEMDRGANPVGAVERPLERTLDAWISGLRSRGVTFTLNNSRLRVSPWPKLSTEDRALLRRHRDEIKKLVRQGLPLPPVPVLGQGAIPESDLDAQLKNRNLEAWRVLHYNDREEIERRRTEATTLMTQVRRPAFPI